MFLKRVLNNVVRSRDKVIVQLNPAFKDDIALSKKIWLNSYIADKKNHRWTHKQSSSEFIDYLKESGVNEKYYSMFQKIHEMNSVFGISEIKPLRFTVIFNVQFYISKDGMSLLIGYVAEKLKGATIESLKIEVYEHNHPHYSDGEGIDYFFSFPER